MKRIISDILCSTGALLVALVPMQAAALGFSSTTVNVDVTKTAKRMADCTEFKLKEVQGTATDPERAYWFNGMCRIWVVNFDGGKEVSSSKPSLLWAEGRATWNSQSNRLEELVKLTDPGNKHSGTLRATFKCLQNPLVQAPSCVRLDFRNMTDWTGFEVPQDANRPLLAGWTTQAEVAALSRAGAPAGARSTTAPVGPMVAGSAPERRLATPVPALVLEHVSAPLDIEAETLVEKKAYLLAGGQLHVQPMESFGNSWSGGRQLFWAGGAVGAVLDLLIDVPQSAKYAVELHMTRAPDYGQLQIQVDGQPASQIFDGKANAVFATGAIQIGTFALTTGQHKVSFMITGKHPTSTGFLAGIDKLRLTQAGAL
ncbi:MAG: hypothetical protein IPI06_12930 [Gammaproteobacteria bacterium]|nr:hypothetical protein [Gammaproteobacteria bacterium]